ncbi:MAG: acetyl-CoA carboxylase biotin carboxyl carrier protein [Phycisphaerae bacterium]|nr:acetyl-CoA carboxylase biotin carboxyl carrier protein [Phycisphaerae bacterium]
MIDIRKLKELVRLMVENDLSELNLQDKEETVTVKRGYAQAGVPMVHHAPVAIMPAPAAGGHGEDGASGGSAPGAGGGGTGGAGAQESEAGLVAITSPMVGTFYSAANPDSPAFVSAGGTVSPDTTVCLIEAMKVYNEIKAEVAGTIERVLVQNGQAVEYGQKLFLVKPA